MGVVLIIAFVMLIATVPSALVNYVTTVRCIGVIVP